jgi:hypothetical protein
MFIVCSSLETRSGNMASMTAETLMTGGARATRGRRETMLVRFFALEGAMRVIVEADNEADARYLCSEMRWDFICLCDD